MKKFVPHYHPIWSFVWPPYVIGMSLICALGFLTNGFDFIWDLKRLPWVILFVAIKITKAVMGHRYGKDTDLTDKDGNQLYTMFLLKGYMPWAMNEKEGEELTSDGMFQTCYGEYAFCYLVYDQEVIDYLLRLNPNIVIC